jgi:N6-adenosine-specific RNA methylase IME4
MLIKSTKDRIKNLTGIEALLGYMPLDEKKKYACIYADPPWQTKAGRGFAGYKVVDGKQIFNSTENKSRELSYPTMTIEQMVELNVSALAAADAHLYMWVTNQYLMKAEHILKAWGFKYSTTLVWAKRPMGGGLGGTFRITTEFLIFATRGKLKAKRNVIGTWFEQKRQYVNGKPCHSKKPDFFYDLIESVSPGNYLEMFARQHRPGWDVFGNEVFNSVELQSNLSCNKSAITNEKPQQL